MTPLPQNAAHGPGAHGLRGPLRNSQPTFAERSWAEGAGESPVDCVPATRRLRAGSAPEKAAPFRDRRVGGKPTPTSPRRGASLCRSNRNPRCCGFLAGLRQPPASMWRRGTFRCFVRGRATLRPRWAPGELSVCPAAVSHQAASRLSPEAGPAAAMRHISAAVASGRACRLQPPLCRPLCRDGGEVK